MAETEPIPISSLDYFQPLGFGGTFRRVFQIFNDRWMSFTTIAFVWYVMGWIFAILLNLVLGNDIAIDGFSSSYGQTGVSYSTDITDDNTVASTGNVIESGDEFVFYLAEVVIYYIFSAVAHGASIWVVAHWYVHQNPALADAFGVATDKCWPLVGATLLLTLLATLPVTLLLVIAFSASNGINPFLILIMVLYLYVLSILTYVTYAAIMVEGKGPWESIRRSFGLTKGYWCDILGITVVWGIVKSLLGLIVAFFIFSGLNNPNGEALLWIGKFLDTIFGILLLAISPIFEGVIYMDLRSKSEALGSVKLGEEIGIGEDSYITMVPTNANHIAPPEASPQAGTLA